MYFKCLLIKIGWISLNYVVNPAFFEVLYTSLSDMELRDGACYCVAEVDNIVTSRRHN